MRRRAPDGRQRHCVSRTAGSPVSVVFESRRGPSWLLDRAVERSRRGWALSSGTEKGAVDLAG